MGLIFLPALTLSSLAFAGPPFVTDDPEPVDDGHWEIDNALLGTVTRGGATVSLPQIDANYGALPNLQLHVQPQAVLVHTRSRTAAGIGDTEIGAKYRFLDDDDHGWVPMVSIYPLYEIPTGNRRRGLGGGVGRTFLPVWLQKTIGRWTVYGGSGYWIDPGAAGKNAWFAGAVALYQVTERLQLGGEMFVLTAQTSGGRDTPGFNLGGSYGITQTYHLLFSAGCGLDNAAISNRFSTYLALQLTFR